MTAPEPFQVQVPDATIDDLHRRLDVVRWPSSLGGWDHGTDLDYMRELVEYWRHRYDWRAQEARLNQVLPGWKASVGGDSIHYAHLPGKGPDPLPLLVLHGWPGSYAEMSKIAPALADPVAHGGHADDAFEVIVPSLPSHGFSYAPTTTGFGADQCAHQMRRLMVDVLGHGRFGAQGGDRGAFVCAGLGLHHSDVVAGIHLNFPCGIPGSGNELTSQEQRWLSDTEEYMRTEGGYMAIQDTRPQTLAYGLHDSPVGMLAWIVEKWRAWSDCDGDIESCFTKDEILINAMIYWVTETMRSSMHYYWEHRTNPPAAVRPVRIECPTGVAAFPHEVMRVLPSAVARKYDLRHWTDMDRGGHFAAMEQPEALVDDVRTFFRALR